MKKLVLSIVAVIAIASVFAFTNNFNEKSESASLTMKYFVYDEYPNNDFEEINDPLNYSLTGSGGTVPLNCPSGSNRCGVEAVDDGTGHPDFSQSYTIRTKN